MISRVKKMGSVTKHIDDEKLVISTEPWKREQQSQEEMMISVRYLILDFVNDEGRHSRP